MTLIKKLPQHLINKLKAGEIVERPASVVKELLENSLDAGATSLEVDIHEGGKKLISIADNGKGMSKEDLLLSVERYATSKISHEDDLTAIASYGFRGEALASISEVSVFRVQTKRASGVGDDFSEDLQSYVGYELYRNDDHFQVKEIPFARDHGTTVFVEDIFHAIPVREKFLKSDATERKYIRQLIASYALMHREKSRILKKEGKVVLNAQPATSLQERLLMFTKQGWADKLQSVQYKNDEMEITGLVGDATLHFSSGQYFRIFVNGRPMNDRLLKRAVMQAYQRQIVPGSYPFVCLFIDADPAIVDVNVHPRKSEVKFLNPGGVFRKIQTVITAAIGQKRVNYAAYRKPEVGSGVSSSGEVDVSGMSARVGSQRSIDRNRQKSLRKSEPLRGQEKRGLTEEQMDALTGIQTELFAGSECASTPHEGVNDFRLTHVKDGEEVNHSSHIYVELDGQQYRLVGQVRAMYIMLEGVDSLVYVDQHALAERIAFERMRVEVSESGFQSADLLQPLTVEYPADVESEKIGEILSEVGFDVSEFGQQKMVIYSVPQVFVDWKVDIELVMNWVWSAELDGEGVTGARIFNLMLDEMLGMKACKASIKAGQVLSMSEMKQLMLDASRYITGLFVCQHGRPSVVSVPKQRVDVLFDR